MVRRKDRRCCIAGCERKHKSRGLCFPCYLAARRAIALGRATWHDLERRGLAEPVTIDVKPSPFTVKLNKKRKSNAEIFGTKDKAPTVTQAPKELPAWARKK